MNVIHSLYEDEKIMMIVMSAELSPCDGWMRILTDFTNKSKHSKQQIADITQLL